MPGLLPEAAQHITLCLDYCLRQYYEPSQLLWCLTTTLEATLNPPMLTLMLKLQLVLRHQTLPATLIPGLQICQRQHLKQHKPSLQMPGTSLYQSPPLLLWSLMTTETPNPPMPGCLRQHLRQHLKQHNAWYWTLSKPSLATLMPDEDWNTKASYICLDTWGNTWSNTNPPCKP